MHAYLAAKVAKRGRGLTALLLSAGLAAGVAGCAASEADTMSGPAPFGLTSTSVLIDVRSPEEFSQGHLAGAININVESPTFGSEIWQLDPEKEYLVYCRSGRRSEIALQQMESMGLNATNLGSVSEASVATGVPVIN
jgi:phage shock protein E